MRAFKTEDGYTFYMQPNGEMTDTPDPADADLVYASLEQLIADGPEVKEVSESGLCSYCGKPRGTGWECINCGSC